jgi:hypothetical protein
MHILEGVSPNNSTLRLITVVGQPVRRHASYIPICKGKLLTSYRIPVGTTYKDSAGTLKGCYRDYQLAAVHQSQFGARTQLCSVSLQQFIVTVEQLAQWALAGLPKDFIQWEAAYAFLMKATERNSSLSWAMTYLSTKPSTRP